MQTLCTLMPKTSKIKCDPITSPMDSLVTSGHAFLAMIDKPGCFSNAQVVESKRKQEFCIVSDRTL